MSLLDLSRLVSWSFGAAVLLQGPLTELLLVGRNMLRQPLALLLLLLFPIMLISFRVVVGAVLLLRQLLRRLTSVTLWSLQFTKASRWLSLLLLLRSAGGSLVLRMGVLRIRTVTLQLAAELALI